MGSKTICDYLSALHLQKGCVYTKVSPIRVQFNVRICCCWKIKYTFLKPIFVDTKLQTTIYMHIHTEVILLMKPTAQYFVNCGTQFCRNL